MSFLQNLRNGSKPVQVTPKIKVTPKKVKPESKPKTRPTANKSKVKAELNTLISLLGSHHQHYKRLGYENQTMMKQRMYQLVEQL